ncbi:LOW QUALITY PROTEIN: uncharacterized protein LOC132724962 [Ruditapes philippinarum]|uniref:LOW QUALITY PROTEIN: uncharacterized protein LOC132724962 n=1 Tax=Ruditapes philippinarum TaxID=129788 RepID=UPI00295BA10D|nr:LOW QUALITY PROTEIN: uncharacterized protein LOC132724962 [Ruditapes philippinarum]
MAAPVRDKYGRFFKLKRGVCEKLRTNRNIIEDHNYVVGNPNTSGDINIPGIPEQRKTNKFFNNKWREGRRVVEFGVLLDNLKVCKECGLGPVPLTAYNVIGEQKKGLSGFLYVICQNVDCAAVNRVTYGKTHRNKQKGMPCFAANTKLGTAMIDSIGGPDRVNNIFATINIPTISHSNLKKMETRAGETVQKISVKSSAAAAKMAFKQEMDEVSQKETDEAKQSIDSLIEDLGIGAMPDASPHTKEVLRQSCASAEADKGDGNWSDLGDTPINQERVTRRQNSQPDGCRKISCERAKIRLQDKFQCRTRLGMSCSVDTAWQKRGFDSLTSHTFFMSKSKYGKKVLKSIVSHRVCGTCNWWARNRKGQAVRPHLCVRNHRGSAKLMESVSGEKGVQELKDEGTPIEYVEGDGDNTLIARVKNNLNIHLKKRFDKNVGKHLFSLHHSKNVKISKITILHLQKCLKYAFAKNAGDKDALRENLNALVPHQFVITVCAILDSVGKVSIRAPKSFHYGNTKSLDYRVHATAACINEGRHYIAELSQVTVTRSRSTCILVSIWTKDKKDNRANVDAGLSPGVHTLKHAEKCQKNRERVQAKMELPSTKRRRLELKKERAVNQGAQEVLEGVSYQSGIGHETNADIEAIPAPIPKGDFKPIQLTNPTLVTFDLETTDLIRGHCLPQITQIAASDLAGTRTFSQYVLPTEPISAGARQVTGLSVDGDRLLHLGQPVEATDIKSALQLFTAWVKKIPNCVLVAHNGKKFDFPVIVIALNCAGVYDMFVDGTKALVDSLSLFRKVIPGRKSYKQEDLVHDILNTSYGAHDAAEDVHALGSLISHLDVDNKTVLTQSFSVSAVCKNMLFNKEKAKNLPSLSVLLYKSICKAPTAENIAGSGLSLNLQHLEAIYKRDGEDGLTNTFIMKNSEGQPRVTAAKRILDSVIPKLVEFFKEKKL